MSAFHDDKLWQEAYVATLDALEATGTLTGNDVVDQVRKHVMMVLTVTAQAANDRDRKIRDANFVMQGISLRLCEAFYPYFGDKKCSVMRYLNN